MDLSRLLSEYVEVNMQLRERHASVTPLLENSLAKIFVLIRTRTGQDFSLYKRSTIIRRIERRMGLHQLTGMDDYIRYLQENPSEIEILSKELLIGVTRFFRDTGAWDAILEKALPELIILNTPQLCCGDAHETDLRLKHAISIDVRIAACKSLCL
jgi:two-component system CheB/CheR fusion protein